MKGTEFYSPHMHIAAPLCCQTTYVCMYIDATDDIKCLMLYIHQYYNVMCIYGIYIPCSCTLHAPDETISA